MARRTNLRTKPQNRRAHDRSAAPIPNNVACSSAVVQGTTTQVKFTFNGPILTNGAIPAFTANGVAPTSVIGSDATSITLGYAGAKAIGQGFVIPTQDPAVRTRNGGWVAAQAALLT